MKERKGFTLIELLVVIAIIALLMSILMPALSRVKDQAKAVVCVNNLHQFGLVWKMYLEDNENKFPVELDDWVFATEKYWRDPELLICPYANKPAESVGGDTRGGTHTAWTDTHNNRRYAISYGLNQYCTSDEAGGRTWDELIPNATVRNPDRVPLMGDCASGGVTPQEKDIPPEFDGQIYYGGTDLDEIRSFCLNRHTEAINMLFLDSSVRDVGLKELWILKWNKIWNLPPEPFPEWPLWMAHMTDPLAPTM